jgi:predicted dehydrogenase
VPEAPPLGWGVIGATARVAQKAVLPAIARSPSARLVAVASERGVTGDAAFGAGRVHRSYADLLRNPDVEAVYVPLPNGLHRPWAEQAAAAGKHVLCEKPLAPTAAAARAIADACVSAGVALLEAYVTPFHPRAAAVDALVRSGRLGALRFARAVFTSTLGRPDDHRWRQEQGGGSLLDVGVYCVAPLLSAAGRLPLRVEATAAIAPSGVDSSFAGWLDFGEGFAASIECSFEAPERQSLEIMGADAAVVVDRAHTPGPGDVGFAVRHRDGGLEQVATGGADPYQAMIEHFAALARGAAAPRRTPAESIAVLTVLDRLREAARATSLDPSMNRSPLERV